MLKLFKTILKAGEATAKYPFAPYETCEDFRGRPEYNVDQCIACAACTRACPANALIMETNEAEGTRRWELSLARCIFCGRCEEVCPTHAIRLSQDFELAVTNKADLYQDATFKLLNCVCCDRPFAPVKAVDYAMALLEQNGLEGQALLSRRQQLETCPECRRKANMLDATNVFQHNYLSANPQECEK